MQVCSARRAACKTTDPCAPVAVLRRCVIAMKQVRRLPHHFNTTSDLHTNPRRQQSNPATLNRGPSFGRRAVAPQRICRTQVYQTGDLANIDGLEPELAAKLPTLLRVRNALYSQRFRTAVEQVRLPSATKCVHATAPPDAVPVRSRPRSCAPFQRAAHECRSRACLRARSRPRWTAAAIATRTGGTCCATMTSSPRAAPRTSST